MKKLTASTAAPLLALKLCEEAGDVGKEISASFLGDWPPVNRRKLNEELDHVEYLVNTLRKKFPREA